MSLEQAINDHAAAIRELAAAIAKSGSTVGTEAPATEVVTKVYKIDTTEPVKEQTPAQKAIAEANAAAAAAKVKKQEAIAEASEPAPAEDKELDYEKDVKPALVQYLKAKGRDAGVALLAKYGAKNGEGVKPEDYAAILADMAG